MYFANVGEVLKPVSKGFFYQKLRPRPAIISKSPMKTSKVLVTRDYVVAHNDSLNLILIMNRC